MAQQNDVILLIHPGGMPNSIAFDVVVKKCIYPIVKTLFKDAFYETFCPIAQQFLNDHPDYVYVGSEEFSHVSNAVIFSELFQFFIFCHGTKLNCGFIEMREPVKNLLSGETNENTI